MVKIGAGRWDAIVIAAVVLLNGVIGHVQEAKAQNAVAALAKITAATSGVLRDGKPQRVPSGELVRGDVLVLAKGDAVGADARLLQAMTLRVQEARQLAVRLRVVAFSRVITSPLLRARRTSELAGFGAVAEIEADAVEWDYGDYEGVRPADIRKERPDWSIFQDGCPRGKSPVQIAERADRLIIRLRALAGNIAIFTHGQFGRVLSVRWIGLRVGQAQHFLLGTASVSIFGFGHERAEEPAIVSWNMSANDWS